jgi:hypothetical protein
MQAGRRSCRCPLQLDDAGDHSTFIKRRKAKTANIDNATGGPWRRAPINYYDKPNSRVGACIESGLPL